MKKILAIFILLFLSLTLSSCNKIKEPKVNGELQEYAEVVDYIVSVKQDLRDDLPKNNRWYNIDMESTLNIYDEEEAIDLKMNIKLDGKVKDTEYAFESKGKINYIIDLKGEVPATKDKEETSKINFKCEIDLIIKEGKSYVKLDINGKVDKNSFEYSLKTNIDNLENQLSYCFNQIGNMLDSEMIEDIVNIDVFNEIFSSFDTLNIIEQLEDALDYETVNIYRKKDKITILDEDEYSSDNNVEKNLSIISFELYDSNQQLKNLEEYNYLYEKYDNSVYEITSKISINKTMFGIVKTPNKEIDYIQ